MRSPFPGMDPYLEHPHRWHPFHTLLVVRLGDAINEVLPEHYYASVEERTYIILGDDPEVVQLPDVLVVGGGAARTRRGGSAVLEPAGVDVLVPAPETLHQRYLEIRDLREGERVVTAIEVLSPSNKRPGAGRDDYAAKRGRVLSSRTNLVEIDLLRVGPRMGALGAPEGVDYGILIARSATRPHARLIPFGVRDTIPPFPLPLAPEDDEPSIDVTAILRSVYERGRYGMRLDYTRPPEPPLNPEDEAWADELLRGRGLR